MNPKVTFTRRKTLLGATTLAAASALGSALPIRLAPSPAYAHAAANTRGDEGQHVFERGFPTPETARRIAANIAKLPGLLRKPITRG